MSLKAAKDSLVSSLFELSKAANDASMATIDFYNASLLNSNGSNQQALEIFHNLATSLKLLTSAANSVNQTSNQIQHQVNPVNTSVPFALDPALTDISMNGAQNFPVLQQLPTQTQPAQVQLQSLQHLQHEQQQQVPQPQPQMPKKKIERDPNAPKKPLTVFFAYSAYARQVLRDERMSKGLPSLSSTEITQEISKKWNELPDHEKDLWKQAYDLELKNYQLEKGKYLESKKNGDMIIRDGPNMAPIPLPDYLKKDSDKRKDYDDGKKDKKKKSKKRKQDGLTGFEDHHHHQE
ncbi:hypothetical protein WICPIJ_007853 [Wickerhamomyces pijperi]|uniref:HMG box domain-containing protein n=1 Tax=Wickerhamomyces pijperi TaxID=599730 RepID=A0A9P8PZE0_WICPI|nr:hypothetical protein WICPIJ_007853 [Wickerhamomyces pijperi]